MISQIKNIPTDKEQQRREVLRPFMLIVALLFLAELFIMFLLSFLGVLTGLEQGGTAENILDAVLLIAISSPAVWILLNRQAEALSARKSAEDSMFLLKKVFENASEAFTFTDAQANIITVNPAFSTITGYSQSEVVGQNPRILNSGRHSRVFYQDMWRNVLNGGMWQGEIWNRRKNGEVYPEWLTVYAVRDDNRQITNFIGVFSDITLRKRMEENILQISNFDALTGLPNREMLNDRLKSACIRANQENAIVAVVFFDLDRFKHINETLGHKGGDELLQVVAQRLSSLADNGDTVSRLGGDEFIILLESVRNVDEIAAMAKRILAHVSSPIKMGGRELYITASMGISVYPNDGADRAALMKNADAALYRAIESGGNTYQFYSEAMSEHALERLTMSSALRYALERNELHVCYQPQVDTNTGVIVGMEALVRWQHPEFGMVSPVVFIPLAEENGMIGMIGEWVLRTACRQTKLWDEAGFRLRVGVNVSARQFMQEDIRGQVLDVLGETGLDPGQLEIEITESMMMSDPEKVIAILEDLRKRGIQVAIDDFGTGYSSLSHLKHFPVDTLKVDQSFTRDVCVDDDGAAIAAAMVSLAHNLGIKSIAEGVETMEQLEFMRKHGCHEIQGYLFSRPLPVKDFELLLRGGAIHPDPAGLVPGKCC
jgi:diguanylate cyclase (GGDEF)-like protein/PAS domain S-box-containing protein